jgi:ribose transport system substrate-binding protein
MIACKDRATFARRVCTLAATVTLFCLGGVAASRAADPSPEEQKKTLSAVPADAQKYYGGYWYAGNVVADPFADWKPHPPP